ncbi:MAG: hypothetical protein IKM65_09185 [Bacteroidaceae bacterium]|nr:hypothetical protein [Bacteroidaceae bacterium]
MFGTNTTDPLLGGDSYSMQMQELGKMQQNLVNRMQALQQLGEQVQQPQQPRSQTPTWDEIDRVTGSMTEKEFEIMTQNAEYQESQRAIDAITQVALMRALRPMVENLKEGKDALDYHLTLINRLKKSAAKEADAEMADFKEYREKYSHLTYDDYLKMKGGKK